MRTQVPMYSYACDAPDCNKGAMSENEDCPDYWELLRFRDGADSYKDFHFCSVSCRLDWEIYANKDSIKRRVI